MTNKLFAGKVALVTGAASGIGRASALAFAQQGAKVVVADVNVSGGEETVRMIVDNGGEAIFVATDVSRAVEVEALVRQTIAHFGRLDVAHNNAAIEGALAPTAAYSEEDWDRTINVNLKGTWLCLKYEILHMLQQGSGAIVNTASVVGLVGTIGLPAYCAAKGGVVQLTKAAALEYAKAGIRINAVCPGATHTPMLNRLMVQPGAETGMLATIPLGRIGNPEEIAAAVVWLCSDAASYVTGHIMVVDGGMIAQ